MDQQPPCKAGGLKEKMMRVQGAVIREQGQTFAVVIVKPHVIQNRSEAEAAINSFMPSACCFDGTRRAGTTSLLRPSGHNTVSV
jgi:hypothetical protein